MGYRARQGPGAIFCHRLQKSRTAGPLAEPLGPCSRLLALFPKAASSRITTQVARGQDLSMPLFRTATLSMAASRGGDGFLLN